MRDLKGQLAATLLKRASIAATDVLRAFGNERGSALVESGPTTVPHSRRRQLHAAELKEAGRTEAWSEAMAHDLVVSVDFEFHLPFRLNLAGLQTEPIPLGPYQLSLQMDDREGSVIYADGVGRTFPYTIAKATLVWLEQSRIPLNRFVDVPLALVANVPLLVLNVFIEAYQLVTSDYTCGPVSIQSLGVVSGHLQLLAEPHPLDISLDYRSRSADHPAAPPTGEVIKAAAAVMTGTGMWVPRRTMNRAYKAFYDGELVLCILMCVTVVELQIQAIASLLAKSSTGIELETRRLERLSLGLLATQVVAPALDKSAGRPASRRLRKWLVDVYALRNRLLHEGDQRLDSATTRASLDLTGQVATELNALASSLAAVDPAVNLWPFEDPTKRANDQPTE